MKIISITLLLINLFTMNILAESKLFGSVANSTNNKEIYAATITLKKDNFLYLLKGIHSTDSTAGSDEAGNYEILDLTDGDYLVSVSKMGFEPIVDQAISIKKGKDKKIDFLLRPQREYIKKCKDCDIELAKDMTLVEGKIEDIYNEYPVMAASVKLDALNSGLFSKSKTYVSSTAKDGYYGFYNIPEGYYALTVQATGYKAYSDTMILINNTQVYKDVSLKSIFDVQIRPCNECPPQGVVVGQVKSVLSDKTVTTGSIEIDGKKVDIDGNGIFATVVNPNEKVHITYNDSVFSLFNKTASVDVYPKTISLVDLQVVPVDVSKFFRTVTGYVKDGEDALAGVTIKLMNSHYNTTTNEKGFYKLDSVFTDKYYVMAKKDTYKIVIDDIDLRGNRVENRLDFFLKKEDKNNFVASLKGNIVDIDSNVVSGASVILMNRNQIIPTTARGEFFIDSLKIGTYSLKVYKAGLDTTYLYDMDLFNPEQYNVRVLLEKDYFKTMEAPKGSGILLGEFRAAKSEKVVGGVQVVLENKKNRYYTFSNNKGRFVLKNLEEGYYKMIVSKQGFLRVEEDDVEIVKGKISRNDNTLEKSDVKQLASMKITGSAMKGSSGALLLDKKKSLSVDDAISSEEFKKAGGVSDAADAVKQITGVTLKDGKYVYIRGLGDRYITTLLNGSPIPSPDPDIQAVPMDMFPAALIENIVISKSYMADMPGNFGGGLVNMKSKKFPDDLIFGGSLEFGYKAGGTFTDMLSYPGGSTDFLGFDDGTRALPTSLKGRDQQDIPRPENASYPGDSTKYIVDQIDSDVNAFNNIMYQNYKIQPIDTKIGFDFGNSYTVFGKKLGLQFNVSYKNSYNSIKDGKKGFYSLTDNIDSVKGLSESYLFDYEKGSHSILWGGLLSADLEIVKGQTVSFNYMYNQIAKDEATYYKGSHYNLSEDQTLETRIMKFNERSIDFAQLTGDHELFKLGFMQENAKLQWRASTSSTSLNEPDTRVFANHFTEIPLYDGDNIIGLDTSYAISVSMYPGPTRFFKTMDESNISFGGDLKLPVYNALSENPINVQVGYSYEKKDRTFKMDKYVYGQKKVAYNGDIQEFFKDENLGFMGYDTINFKGTQVIKNSFGHYITKDDAATDDYKATSSFPAFYLTTEVPIARDLGVSAGGRFEQTNMFVTNSKDSGEINQNNFLLSLATSYNLNEEMKLRGSYSNTLVRPSVREFAPFSAVENPKEGAITGNTDLKITNMHNFNIRWEWYYSPGELFSAGLFYNRLVNPIENVLLNQNGEMSWQNVANADIQGIELEFKKRLLDEYIEDDFRIGGNITLINSDVIIDSATMLDIVQLNPNAEQTRDLQGQSPYVINLLMTYTYKPIATSFALYYNVFGSKLSGIFIGATPNPYQFPEHILNFSVTQPIGEQERLKVKFSAKNILNADFNNASLFKDKEYTLNSYSQGRSFSIGVSYTFDAAKNKEFDQKRAAKFENIDVNKRELRLY